MKIERELLTYKYNYQSLNHHILVAIDDNKTLLSAVNIYLEENASNSLKTSDKYSGAIKRFFEFVISQRSEEIIDSNFWREISYSQIKEWQAFQVYQRDKANNKKPSDKTIFENASIIHQFYVWARKKEFPVAIDAVLKDWKFNYRDESKLLTIHSMLSGSNPDHANIDIGSSNARARARVDNSIVIMDNDDIKALMNSYVDPVYPALLMLALGTGMREEGCVSMPYIGTGVNAHIRPYPEIMNTIKSGGNAKTFGFTVTEKGRKTRTVQVNMAAWKTICSFYLPLYYERKKLFQLKYPEKNANSHFFLNKKGEPVTEKNISDMTYIAKRGIEAFPWSFHSARDWYATNFITKHLSKSKINNMHYDAAVEELLRSQLGHKDIKTTYMYYIKKASIIIALQDGLLDYSLGMDSDFFGDLLPEM